MEILLEHDMLSGKQAKDILVKEKQLMALVKKARERKWGERLQTLRSIGEPRGGRGPGTDALRRWCPVRGPDHGNPGHGHGDTLLQN